MKLIVNGKAYDEREARISPRDRGALFGDGLFETFRVEKGIPLFLEEHLTRLLRSAEKLRFARIPGKSELRGAIRKAIGSNRVNSGYLRLTLTRGQGGFGVPLSRLDRSGYWVEAREQPLDPVWYQGVRATIGKRIRNPHSPIAGVKSLNFLENILAREAARAVGAQETILLTVEGDLCEGASSNLFLVRGGEIMTPGLDRGPLPGVVRSWVLREAPRIGIPVKECQIGPEELRRSEELFFTNSTWGPFPCVEVDGMAVGDGSPGPVTQRLIQSWQEEIQRQTRGR